MEIPRTILYAGERFRIQTTGRYYQSGRKGSPERLLHRRIWIDNFGAIPEGFVVHHKDGDWTNNRIENLELVDRSSHATQHMRERMSDPEYRSVAYQALASARIAASAWHGSPDGIAWHSEHGKRTWEGREPSRVACSVCGKEYDTFFPTRSRFCSKACEQKAWYQRHKTATGICVLCGAQFVFNKFRKQECCSRLCANRLRGQRSKGLQPDAGR